MSDKLFRTLTIGGVTYTLNDTTKLEKPNNTGEPGQLLAKTDDGSHWITPTDILDYNMLRNRPRFGGGRGIVHTYNGAYDLYFMIVRFEGRGDGFEETHSWWDPNVRVVDPEAAHFNMTWVAPSEDHPLLKLYYDNTKNKWVLHVYKDFGLIHPYDPDIYWYLDDQELFQSGFLSKDFITETNTKYFIYFSWVTDRQDSHDFSIDTDIVATNEHVNALVGDINSILDNINGEVI